MATPKTKKVIHPSADFPANWELADAVSFQALARGDASEAQQRRALNWLMYSATGLYDSDYRPDQREHAFVSGRRNIGLQIMKLLAINTQAFTDVNQ